jgi:hypothetical protein
VTSFNLQRQAKPYPADRARGGEIILRRRWQRALFIAGLALPVFLFCLLLLFR